MPVIEKNQNSEILVPRLIVLRGSPGIGKSTVTSKVCALNSAKKKTTISVDAMQHIDLRKPSKDKEKLGIKHSALLTRSFLSEGFDVVLDYVFEDTADLQKVIDYIKNDSESTVHFYLQMFYLDAPIEKVVKRNQSRSGKRGEYMNTALLRKLYQKVSATKGTVENEIILDTSDLSAKQTARTILSCSMAVRDGIVPVEVELPEEDAKRALVDD